MPTSSTEVVTKIVPEPGPLSPRKSLQEIVVPEGLKVELVASEPLVMDPVAFDWGWDGRLWVVEMGDYPNGMRWNGPGDPKGDFGGRVKILTDTDGDGVYDKASVFLDKLPFPTAIKVWGDGILIATGSELLYVEDANGDQVADVQKPLYSGFTEGNQQHRINGLRWGLDNWLYLANGGSGGSVQPADQDAPPVDIGGFDLRIRPSTSELQTQSGLSQSGRFRNDWGDWFGCRSGNPLWHYILDERYLSRNPYVSGPIVRRDVPEQPGKALICPLSQTMPRFNDYANTNRFTSACSPAFYRDKSLGEMLAGNVFICEPVHNLVHREIVSPAGVSFSSRRAPEETTSEFLASRDLWFRPVMIRTGPDGGLWIADMYRFVIEHPEWILPEVQISLDMRAGSSRGRIYRVLREGASPQVPRLGEWTQKQLVAALESPNGWIRDMVQQRFVENAQQAPIEDLQKLVVSGNRVTARLHALCTLDGVGRLSPAILANALTDLNPGVRRWAVRFTESFSGDSRLFRAVARMLAEEKDPQVLLQTLYSLRLWSNVEPQSGDIARQATRLLGNLAYRHASDEILRAAAISSIGESNVELLLTGWIEAYSKEPLPAAETLVHAGFSTLTGIGNQATITKLTALFVERAAKTSASGQLRAVDILLDAVDDRSGQGKQYITSELLEQTRQRVQQETPDVTAIRILGKSSQDNQDVTLIANILSPQQSPATQLPAAKALFNMGTDTAFNALLDKWDSYPPNLRRHVLDSIGQRPDWTLKLLEAIEAEKVVISQISVHRRAQWLSHQDEKIRSKAEHVFSSAIDPNRASLVEQYHQGLPSAGDALRGKAIFSKSCASCHRFNALGHAVGPDLAALKDRSSQAILIAVLDPNRAVENKYLNYAVETEDGLIFTGMLADETTATITLRGPENKEKQILRNEIETLTATGKVHYARRDGKRPHPR